MLSIIVTDVLLYTERLIRDATETVSAAAWGDEFAGPENDGPKYFNSCMENAGPAWNMMDQIACLENALPGKQETQLSLTNRATHLCKCNDVAV